MKNLLTYLFIVSIGLFLFGCDKPAPTELFDDSQEELPVVESPPTEMPEDTNISIPDDESGLETHTVTAGETLGQISGRYEVTLEEIMSANGMSNPNFLSVGQELIIPLAETVEEVVEEAPETSDSGAEDVLPTPIPTEPAGEGEVIIEIAEVAEARVLAVLGINTGKPGQLRYCRQ